MPPELEKLLALVEADGVLLSARIKVQCVEPVGDSVCGEVVEGDLVVTDHDSEEAPEMVLRCPKCSERTGSEVLIPIVILAGFAVSDTLESGEEQPETTAEKLERAIVVDPLPGQTA